MNHIELGAGLASTPSIHLGSGEGKEITVVEQTSTGAIVVEKATTDASAKTGEMSWRELSK